MAENESMKPAAEGRQELAGWISERLDAGVEQDELVVNLVERGMVLDGAAIIVDSVAEVRRARLRSSGIRSIAWGVVLLGAGAGLTALLSQGGVDVLFYGLLGWGLIKVIVGAVELLDH